MTHSDPAAGAQPAQITAPCLHNVSSLCFSQYFPSPRRSWRHEITKDAVPAELHLEGIIPISCPHTKHRPWCCWHPSGASHSRDMVIPRVLSLTLIFQLYCCWEEQLAFVGFGPAPPHSHLAFPAVTGVSQSSQRRNSTSLSTGLETISLLDEPGANPVGGLHIYPTSGQNFWENRTGLKHIRVIPTLHNQGVHMLCLGITFSIAI